MTREEYVAEFSNLANRMVEITKKKNADYTGGNPNAFHNFDLVEHLSNGKITAEMGIFVRMCDKFTRTAGLIFNGDHPAVVEEKLDDTLCDLAVYATIMRIRRQARLVEECEAPRAMYDEGGFA